MNICENCIEKSACDQVIYDCPLVAAADYPSRIKRKFAYKFDNSKGEEFIGSFDNYDEAKDFAYRTGLCCLGRA
jgi:hypothetical protein